ncbi:MAG: GIY-YIG nuclease family protein [Betaproteobacteria bacterium]|nr:GIY-YIG nuclease family protein [Betaproteobacteria bacterium]
MKNYYVYLLASAKRGTLYCGVTSDLPARVWQHREKLVAGFSEKYGVSLLVWYEVHEDVHAALAREKQIKKWNRVWKIELIEKENSEWRDSYPEVC